MKDTFLDIKQCPGDMAAIESYYKRAASFLKTADPSRGNWHDKAIRTLERGSGYEDFYHLNEEERDVVVQDMALKMMSVPSAKGQYLHVLILSAEDKGRDLDTAELVRVVAEACGRSDLQNFVHTFGLQGGDTQYQDPYCWMRYEGAIDRKTWMDEWA